MPSLSRRSSSSNPVNHPHRTTDPKMTHSGIELQQRCSVRLAMLHVEPVTHPS
jgi:hypothetical protein